MVVTLETTSPNNQMSSLGPSFSQQETPAHRGVLLSQFSPATAAPQQQVLALVTSPYTCRLWDEP